MNTLRSIVAMLAGSLFFASTLSACSSTDDSTQVTVAITSETQIPRELNQLEVVVIDSRGSEASRILHDVQSPGFFPATLAIIPREKASLDGPVTVEIRGQLRQSSGEVVTAVLRRAVVTYAEGRNLLVPMPLRMACFAVDYCGPDETCAGGTCQPARLNGSSLPDYAEGLVFGAAAGDSCFSEETCLADSVAIPLDPNTPEELCEIELPADVEVGDDGRPRVNLSVQWAVAPERVIALDEDDPIEGWTLVAPNRARLSEGVCASLRDVTNAQGERLIPDEALAVYVARTCSPKRRLQPFCTSSDGHVAIGAALANPEPSSP